jgi:hypothetical protein
MEESPERIRAGITLWGELHEQMGRQLLEYNYSMWNLGIMDAEVKSFFFKMVHGELWLNQQRAHFEDLDRWCTFCGIMKKRELAGRGINEGMAEYVAEMRGLPPENTDHLFWGCEVSRRVINEFFRITCGEQGRVVSKEKFLGGWLDISRICTIIGLFTVHYVKYYIYTCRMRRRLPIVQHLVDEFDYTTLRLTRSVKWRDGLQQLVYTLSSIWM